MPRNGLLGSATGFAPPTESILGADMAGAMEGFGRQSGRFGQCLAACARVNCLDVGECGAKPFAPVGHRVPDLLRASLDEIPGMYPQAPQRAEIGPYPHRDHPRQMQCAREISPPCSQASSGPMVHPQGQGHRRHGGADLEQEGGPAGFWPVDAAFPQQVEQHGRS